VSPAATPPTGIYSGDVDCSGEATPVSAVDSLKVLRFVAGLPVSQHEPCTDIGEMAEWGWKMGDVGCSGTVNSVDALKILRYTALLPVGLPDGCPRIGVAPLANATRVGDLLGESLVPVVTYMFPQDGDSLAEPPPVLQLCFAVPVNNRDLDKGGDFRFRLITPDDRSVGMRIVFQSDGYGVYIEQSLKGTSYDGEWTFEWRVTDFVTLEPKEGVVTFAVDPGGRAVLEDPPPPCLNPQGIRPGDLNCDGAISAVDSLAALRFVADLPAMIQNEP